MISTGRGAGYLTTGGWLPEGVERPAGFNQATEQSSLPIDHLFIIVLISNIICHTDMYESITRDQGRWALLMWEVHSYTCYRGNYIIYSQVYKPKRRTLIQAHNNKVANYEEGVTQPAL